MPKYQSSDTNDSNIVTGPVGSDQAAAMIRDKLNQIYGEEPDAQTEIEEADNTTHRSKHQKFMYKLGLSGKDLATIQTEWHDYYTALSPEEKHQVWQEFYDSQSAVTNAPATPKAQDYSKHLTEHRIQTALIKRPRKTPKATQPPTKVVNSTKSRVRANSQLTLKHHLQSLLFGLSMGLIVVFIFMFSFFNEVFIAPFIEPSRASADTPIIISSNGVAPTATPEVIVPKINVEIPVDYNETSTNESVIESDLEAGVVHYPTTVFPGQNGNAAFFGHSSNNIFNPGKYKFAFVLLHTLVNGDTFYLTYNDKVYVYKVISKTVVSPNDINVLNSVPGQTATATLITCDPPGTSINRLVVVGQQISPSPSTNTTVAAPTVTASSKPTTLPGNGPSLWTRFIDTVIGKLITMLVIAASVVFAARKLDKRLRPY